MSTSPRPPSRSREITRPFASRFVPTGTPSTIGPSASGSRPTPSRPSRAITRELGSAARLGTTSGPGQTSEATERPASWSRTVSRSVRCVPSGAWRTLVETRMASGAPGVRDAIWKILTVVLWIAGLTAPFWSGMSLPATFEGWFGQGALGWFFAGLAAISSAYMLATFYHGLRYRPVVTCDDDALPTVTLIVPAFNEGPMVRVSLESALSNDYPREKLRILAIDDGSKDDTWVHIQAVARKHPDVVEAIAMPKNGGKREALRHGFERATGDIIVTVDSDSKLAPDAIRNIVAPMVSDERVAAVAGKVVVLNRYANFLTRLLAARFFVTFDLGRAAQSQFGAVLCCPGALAAYRRSALMEVLSRWSSQLFLGMPCTIGEDRALTTWLMRAGYRAMYQSTAVVETLVPTTIKGTVKMFIRWERGNLREDIVMLPVLFTRWRSRDRWWPTLEIAFELLQLPVGLVALALAVAHFVERPLDLLFVLGTVGTIACAQSLYALRSQRDSGFVFGIAYAFVAFFGLQWILPYSALTIRNGRWMTR